MKIFSLQEIILVFWLSLFCGLTIGYLGATINVKREEIKHNAAQYNSITGAFEWKQ